MVASHIRAIPHDRPPVPPGDQVHFHSQTTNPELWRTTVPFVVRERCRRHKGLIATWTAIHWLIVLHAASGRAHFGMREIAEEAGVGRNELAGPTGYIQRLVDLGLIRIIGYKSFKGLREPRPIYQIDLAELERLSLDLVPDMLRERHIDRPPPADLDPRRPRLTLLPTADDRLTTITDEPYPQLAPLHSKPDELPPASKQRPPQIGRGGASSACPEVERLPDMRYGTPQTGTDYGEGMLYRVGSSHESGIATHQHEQYSVQNGHETPGIGQGMHVAETDLAHNRDMDGRKERLNEGVRQPLAHDLLQSLVAQATRAVLATLQTQGSPAVPEVPLALSSIPPAPASAEPLSAPVLTLWQGDQPILRRRDAHQLALLAAEYDEPTGGHGAYWLGRAILMADLCLGDRDQPITIAYVRRILRRWCEEGSWGSDREAVEWHARAVPEPLARTQQTADTGSEEAQRHPAVRAYVEALHEAPNTVQAAQIAEVVTDLAAWRQVLTDWLLNGWGERSVGKMLDRYQKSTTPKVSSEPAPSVAVIHTYPGLTPEQRDRWIRKFHAAATPAEKRAVLARLEQEHPR